MKFIPGAPFDYLKKNNCGKCINIMHIIESIENYKMRLIVFTHLLWHFVVAVKRNVKFKFTADKLIKYSVQGKPKLNKHRPISLTSKPLIFK
jgi:hypothetical protein